MPSVRAAETDRFVGFGGRYAISGIGVVRDQRQVVPGDLAAEIHHIGRVPRNFHHLFTGLIGCAGGIDSHHCVSPPVLRESDQHPRMGRACHRAHHDMVEHDPHLGFLRTDLFGKAHVAEPAELVHRCACRYCIRLAAFGPDSLERTLPAFPDPDVETFIDEFNLRSHDTAHQDIADPVVDGILKRHPAFLDEVTLHAQLGGDRGNLTGVIRLHATDRHQGVGVRRDRIGNDVFQLANLVAAEREPGVAILAFRIDFDASAQVLRKPVELLDRRRPRT